MKKLIFILLFAFSTQVIIAQQTKQKLKLEINNAISDCPKYGDNGSFLKEMFNDLNIIVNSKDEKNHIFIIEIESENFDEAKNIIKDYLLKQHYPSSHLIKITAYE